MMGYFESQEEAGGHQWGLPPAGVGVPPHASSSLNALIYINAQITQPVLVGTRARPTALERGDSGPQGAQSWRDPGVHINHSSHVFLISCRCQIPNRASMGGESGQPRIPCGCDQPQTCPAPPPERPKSPKPEPKARSRWKGS